jgi:hypothetical protein
MRDAIGRLTRTTSATVALLLCGLANAAPPPEVTGLQFCPASESCLQWSAATGATSYKVYVGIR